jgi:hypothetical protein
MPARSGSTNLKFAKSKTTFQEKKDHGQTITELKTFTKPNLDDGNRFYDDNLQLQSTYGDVDANHTRSVYTAVKNTRGNSFKAYKGPHAVSGVDVIDVANKSTRSYRSSNGYMPKNYTTRPRTAALQRLQKKKEENERAERERKEQEERAKVEAERAEKNEQEMKRAASRSRSPQK